MSRYYPTTSSLKVKLTQFFISSDNHELVLPKSHHRYLDEFLILIFERLIILAENIRRG